MIKYNTRNDFFNTLGKGLKICEIGVFKGEFSKFIYESLEPKELHLIDIFEGKMCSGDKDGKNIVWVDLEDEYLILQKHFTENKNVIIHKGFSNQVLNNFEDNYFDVIYIDGDHTYDGVKSDLYLSFKKVKNGGLICGHDYTEKMFPGVVKAVNEFCSEVNLTINHLTDDGCPTFGIIKNI